MNEPIGLPPRLIPALTTPDSSSCRRWHDAPVKPGRCCVAGHASTLAEPSAPGNRKPEFGEKARLQQHRPGVLLCLERAGENANGWRGWPAILVPGRPTFAWQASGALAAHREFVEQI